MSRNVTFGDKVCPICGETFTPTAANQKYCSQQCSRHKEAVRRIDYIKGRGKERSTINPELIYAYNCECAICHWSIPDWLPTYKRTERMHGLNYHHIIPVSEGGSSDEENIVVLCPNCHKMAHAGILTEEELKKHTFTKEQAEKLADEHHIKAKLSAATLLEKTILHG